MSLNLRVSEALSSFKGQVETLLVALASEQARFYEIFEIVFGSGFIREEAETIRLAWAVGNFSKVATIDVVSSEVLGNALGAYAASENKIYLSDVFLATATSEEIVAVLLEEIGHYVDARVNVVDTLGDEGEYFSAILRNEDLSIQDINRIQTEDDSREIAVDGVWLTVEQATNDYDFYNDDNSEIFIDTSLDVDTDRWFYNGYSIGGSDATLYNGYDGTGEVYSGNISESNGIIINGYLGWGYVVNGRNSGSMGVIYNGYVSGSKGIIYNSYWSKGIIYNSYWSESTGIIYNGYDGTGEIHNGFFGATSEIYNGSYGGTGYFYNGYNSGSEGYLYSGYDDHDAAYLFNGNQIGSTGYLYNGYDGTGYLYNAYEGIGSLYNGRYSGSTGYLYNGYNSGSTGIIYNGYNSGISTGHLYNADEDGSTGYLYNGYNSGSTGIIYNGYEGIGKIHNAHSSGSTGIIYNGYNGTGTIYNGYNAFGGIYNSGIVYNGINGSIINSINNIDSVIYNYSGGYLINDGSIINNANALIFNFEGGYLINDGSIENSGTFSNGGLLGVSFIDNNYYAGGHLINNGSIENSGNFSNGGLLAGGGTFTGQLAVTGGTIAPGGSYNGYTDTDGIFTGDFTDTDGVFTIEGDFTQSDAATLQLSLSSLGSYDQLKITGNANFDGGSIELIGLSTFANSDFGSGETNLVLIDGDSDNDLNGTLTINSTLIDSLNSAVNAYDTSELDFSVEILSNDLVLNIREPNVAPTITSSATANFIENGTGTAYTVESFDPEGASITYGLDTTGDNSLFDIDSTTGEITFKIPPDYENPTDSNGDNIYDVTVTASDGFLSDSQDVSITVVNDGVDPESYPRLLAGAGSGENSLVELSIDPVEAILVGPSTSLRGLDVDPTTGLLYGAFNSLSIVNPTDGSYEEIGPILGGTEELFVNSVTFSPSGTLYATDYKPDSGIYGFYRIDTDTATATFIGSIPENAWAIEFAPDGTLYGAGLDLITIDPTNGNILSTVGSLGGAFIDGLDIAKDGTIYGVDSLPSTSELYQIDSANGSTILLGTYDSYVSSIVSVGAAAGTPETPNVTVAIRSGTLLLANSSVAEDGTSNLEYVFSRTGDTTNSLTINYGVSGTADADDYTGATPGTGQSITFEAGSSTASLTVDPTVDTTVEPDETVIVTVEDGTGYNATVSPGSGILQNSTATGTIADDDTEYQSSTRLLAGTGSGGTNEYSLVEFSIDPVEEEILVGPSTFFTGLDVDPTTGLLYGASSSLRIVDPTDGSYEEIGTILSGTQSLLVSSITFSPSGILYATDYNLDLDVYDFYTIDTDNASATFISSISEDAWAIEFAPDGTLYGAGLDLITIDPTNGNILSTVGSLGGAFIADLDIASDGTIYGVDSIHGVDSIYGVDNLPSTSELYQIDSANGSTILLGTYDSYVSSIVSVGAGAAVTQPGIIGFDNSAYFVNEDGTTIHEMMLTRTDGSDGEVSVTLTPSDDIATSPDDYDASPVTVTFADGETSKTVVIPIVDDSIVEGAETVNLILSAPTGDAILGTQTTAVLTINDNDVEVEPPTDPEVIIDGSNVSGGDNNNVIPVPGDRRYTVMSQGGDDTIQVDSTIHVITERPSGGTDTIESSVSYNLAGHHYIENLTLTGTGNINGIGNRRDNRIQGNSGQNRLTGLQGIDTFVFEFGHSRLSAPDRLRDFELGVESIDILTEGGTISLREFSNAGSINSTSLGEAVASVFLDADALTPEAQPLAINSGAFIDITTPGIAGRYLLINDSLDGFQDASDLMINITNVV